MTSYISSSRILPMGSNTPRVVFISDFPRDGNPISDASLRVIQKAYPGNLSECAFLSLSQYAPANKDFSYLEGSQELSSSLKYLEDFLLSSQPSVIITLGEKALNHFTGEYNVNNWRGSPLLWNGIKLLPTLDPNIFGVFTTVQFDLQRALDYANNKHKVYNDDFSILKDAVSQRNAFEEILSSEKVTIDIETKRDGLLTLLCVGFGLSAERAICFVCNSPSAIQNVAELIPLIKNPIYHNGLFDISALRYFHNIEAPPLAGDTLVAQHVLEPEMPKDLGWLCSTLTWRSCYWGSVKFDDDKTWNARKALDDLYIYNCKDVCVTYEAYDILEKELSDIPDLRRVYEFELECLEASMHISSTGFCVDTERRELLRSTIKERWITDYATLHLLAGKEVLVSSPKQVKEFLYTDLGLPVRRDRDGSVTTGEDALVGLISYVQGEIKKVRTQESIMKKKTQIAMLKLLLNIRKYDKLLSSYVDVPLSPDGRLRGILKVASTESGRWAGGNYLDGTGLNVQTLPREVISIG
jgi:hypothetical protein